MHKNPDPQHHLFDMSAAGVTQDKMVFFYLFMYIITKVYFVFIKPLLKQIDSLEKDVDIDEGLDPYWNCLSGSQQKVIYTNEVYSRQ